MLSSAAADVGCCPFGRFLSRPSLLWPTLALGQLAAASHVSLARWKPRGALSFHEEYMLQKSHQRKEGCPERYAGQLCWAGWSSIHRSEISKYFPAHSACTTKQIPFLFSRIHPLIFHTPACSLTSVYSFYLKVNTFKWKINTKGGSKLFSDLRFPVGYGIRSFEGI